MTEKKAKKESALTGINSRKKKHKNRFNTLTSKEWLPFQKSWFKYDGKEKLYRENIRFFTSADPDLGSIYYDGSEIELIKSIADELNIKIISSKEYNDEPIQFGLVDLLPVITEKATLEQYQKAKEKILKAVKKIAANIVERRFLAVLIPNVQRENIFFPFAWDLAKEISTVLSLKDEKIGCIEGDLEDISSSYFIPSKKYFYCLYFRKDEFSGDAESNNKLNIFQNITQQKRKGIYNNIPAWFILKPQPRKKNEILHPAKYPEALVEMFINTFTKEGDNVFDPMSGTGSTQMAALKMGRNGYGTELSEFFAGIANNRCKKFQEPTQGDIFKASKTEKNKILNKDARLVSKKDFPAIDYVITSPPYWDMLNMKGAENQAKRLEKGLQTNYSDSEKDLGNINVYRDFLNQLCEIYFSIFKLMKEGSYITIVVKNIKKKGRNYPFAWDLANQLQKKMILLPEVFWCQDDISIAPYGYGNTWVSNTFHQYCLTFQKPHKK